MPLYSFYPCRSDGCATTWLCAELDDDRAAATYAAAALASHPSAMSVLVLDGEREVAVVTAVARAPYEDARRRVSGPRAASSALATLKRPTGGVAPKP